MKVVVINNQWLGMVRQWRDMIYDGQGADSSMGDPMAVKPAGEADIYPMIPAGGSDMDIIMGDEDLKHVSPGKQGSNP